MHYKNKCKVQCHNTIQVCSYALLFLMGSNHLQSTDSILSRVATDPKLNFCYNPTQQIAEYSSTLWTKMDR